MTARTVLAVIYHLHVVDGVGDEVAQSLVICLCREAIAQVVDAESVIVAGDEVDASRTLDLLVEVGVGDAVHGRGISQLLEEWRLIVQAGGKAEGRVLAVGRDDAQ